MNWEKLKSPTRATFKNPNFQFSCELAKSLKYSPRPAFNNSNFESNNELIKAITQFEVPC